MTAIRSDALFGLPRCDALHSKSRSLLASVHRLSAGGVAVGDDDGDADYCDATRLARSLGIDRTD
jgi:hypothetical protein